MKSLITTIGSQLTSKLTIVGELTVFFFRVLKQTVTPPFNFKLIKEQIDEEGFKSLSIVILSALAIGMVMILQLAFSFKKFGAKALVGPVVSLAIVRELGPIITSLLVGARVGSGITAEIGSMQVSEQIDALRTLGADPIKKLVVPRFIAAMIAFPFLTVIADFAGIVGALLMANLELGVSPLQFIESTILEVTMTDFSTGVLKTVFFGIITAIIGCFVGMRAQGGTQGVGRATTITVVISLILIIISDFFLTKLFLIIWPEVGS